MMLTCPFGSKRLRPNMLSESDAMTTRMAVAIASMGSGRYRVECSRTPSTSTLTRRPYARKWLDYSFRLLSCPSAMSHLVCTPSHYSTLLIGLTQFIHSIKATTIQS